MSEVIYSEDDVAALFGGQGVFHDQMGKTAYKKFAVAREVFSEASEKVGIDLARVSFGDLTYLQEDSRIIQPAIVSVNLAEYAAWREVNERDASVVSGLSLGMYAAMGAAGVFETYGDAVDATAQRARIMHDVSTRNPGKMAGVVGLALDELEPIVQKAGAGIAVIRDRVRSSLVVTGGEDQVDQVEKEAKNRGVRIWEHLDIFGAFHFRHHEESRMPFEAKLRNYNLNNPSIRLLGNSAIYLTSAEAAITHALDQLTETADWDAVISLLDAQGIKQVLETGPDESRGLARQMGKRYKTKQIQFPVAG